MTEFLREKINTLNQMILQQVLEIFQHQLQVDVAEKSTGDAQVDQSMKSVAQNSAAIVLAGNTRLALYRERLAQLQAELDATGAN